MNVGMLWLDNDPRSALTAKVARAADYYRRKYGLMPDMCLVHPSMLVDPCPDLIDGYIGKVAIRPNRSILPGHLWIGIEEKPDSFQRKENFTRVERTLHEGREGVR
ncbi:MAG: hypothetical protein ABIF04_05870 [Chloroflexota bacterium]